MVSHGRSPKVIQATQKELARHQTNLIKIVRDKLRSIFIYQYFSNIPIKFLHYETKEHLVFLHIIMLEWRKDKDSEVLTNR